MDLYQALDDICLLPETSRRRLREISNLRSFHKGYILMKAGRVETFLYFIKKGIVRAYSCQQDTEITFWFGKEGEAVLSMRSYVEDKGGYENIELLEACDLYEIRLADLRRLFGEDIHIANWGRRFAEKELIKTEERLISRQFRTASERYQSLLKDDPGLLQRVQLGYIASFLGITRVSLSRIRAEVR